MAQQTALQFFLMGLVDLEIGKGIPTDKEVELRKLFEQAKQMEKEQRNKDYNAGYTDAQCNHVNDCENYGNEQDYQNAKD